MTNNPNGWPFPDKPGVPLNPERDGFHWLMRKGAAWAEAWRWDPDADGCGTDYSGAWAESEGDGQPDEMARWYAYLGPCLTPAEVAAREQAAAEEMRAICARAAMVELGWNNGSVEARKAIAMQAAHTVNAIRERPIPSSDALAVSPIAEALRDE